MPGARGPVAQLAPTWTVHGPSSGQTTIQAWVSVPAGPRGEGIDAVDLVAVDRSRAGEAHDLCGVTVRLV